MTGSNFLANGGLPANGPSASFTLAQARAATVRLCAQRAAAGIL